MKRIEDIEILDDAQLEAAALNEGAPVPEGLQERLETVLAAKVLVGTKAAGPATEPASPKAKVIRPLAWTALAAAAATAVLIALPLIGRPPLEDTFDDPYLAYAQVESAFRTISDKMVEGIDLAAEAGQAASRPMEIIDKINRK